MQIPADNPLSIRHLPVIGYQDLDNIFNIAAEAHNHSGIKKAVCKWKKEGLEEWNSIEMGTTDGENFVAVIPNDGLTVNDKIDYYLEFESNNEKQMNSPITGPEGYYTFYFDPATGLNEEHNSINTDFSLNAMPNPANDYTQINFHLEETGNASLMIYDTYGNHLSTLVNKKLQSGNYQFNFGTSGLLSGVYFCRLIADGKSKVINLSVIK